MPENDKEWTYTTNGRLIPPQQLDFSDPNALSVYLKSFVFQERLTGEKREKRLKASHMLELLGCEGMCRGSVCVYHQKRGYFCKGLEDFEKAYNAALKLSSDRKDEDDDV